MSIVCRESSVSEKRERVIKELCEGQECATTLKFLLLQKPIGADNDDSESLSAEALLEKVLRSFTKTLFVLSSSEGVGAVVAASTNDLRSDGSSESSKRSFPPVMKDRRGSYKRRKTEETWTNVSQNTEDKYAWRKYGQKEILNSKFPRSYYRCTRKYDNGCRATKQVQRIQENPVMYQITYIGHHTCNNNKDSHNLKAPQMVTYFDTNWNSSYPVMMNSNNNHDEHCDPPIRIPTIVKQEYPKEDNQSQSGLTDNLDPSLWSDLKDFELSKPSFKMPPHDHNNSADATVMYSCTASQSLDMDFGVLSSHFCTGFNFDDIFI